MTANEIAAMVDARRVGDGWLGKCPGHEDAKPSLSIAEGRNGRVLLKCHAGCNIEQIVAALGLTMRDLFASNGQGTPRSAEDAQPSTLTDYAAYVGLKREWLTKTFGILSEMDSHGAYVAIPYRNAQGNVTACRFRRGRKFWWEAGTKPPLYGLELLAEVTGDTAVIIVEGESDVHVLTAHGFTAVGVPGAANWKPEFAHTLKRHHVFVWQEPDAAGRKFVAAVTRDLPGAKVIVPPPGLKDARDLHLVDRDHFDERIQALLEVARAADRTREAVASSAAVVVTLSDVKSERVTWLWEKRIPAGKLTLLVGDPGVAKSTIAIDITARVSRGGAMPDGTQARAGDVLYCTLEDGLADTIRPRLDAAAADCARVHSVTGIIQCDDEGRRRDVGALEIPRDLPHLEQIIAERGVVLLVFDPIKAYTGGSLNEWRDGDVRRVLGPLAAMAERTGVAVVAIVHLTKAAATPAQYRVSGSIAWTGAARSVLLAAPDPGACDRDNDRRVLAPLKASLARLAPTLAYQVVSVDGSDDGPAQVRWLGESGVTARQALAPQGDEEERTAADRARELLRDLLRDGVPRPQREVVRDVCRQADASDTTVRRVAREMSVESVRAGFGSGATYTWRLPPSMLATQTSLASMEKGETPNPVVGDAIAHAPHAGQPHAGQPALASMEETPRRCSHGHPLWHQPSHRADRGWVCPTCHPDAARALGWEGPS